MTNLLDQLPPRGMKKCNADSRFHPSFAGTGHTKTEMTHIFVNFIRRAKNELTDDC